MTAHHSRLSPLNFAGLIASERSLQEAQQAGPRRAIEVTYWACPDCSSQFEEEDDALDCCDDSSHSEELYRCPVCARHATDPYDAADCCLWRDFDAPTRWRMAAAVDAGSTWAEQLGQQA